MWGGELPGAGFCQLGTVGGGLEWSGISKEAPNCLSCWLSKSAEGKPGQGFRVDIGRCAALIPRMAAPLALSRPPLSSLTAGNLGCSVYVTRSPG